MESQIRAREAELRGANVTTQQEWIDGWRSPVNTYSDTDAIIRRNVENLTQGNVSHSTDAEYKAAERSDRRYLEERIKMDDERMKAQRDYREKRQDLQDRMSKATSGSSEYSRLQNQLNELDKGYAEREQKFEKDFRNMDVKYSGKTW